MASGPESLFLTIARVLSPWGTNGEVKVEVLTDFPEKLAAQNQVYLNGRQLTIERSQSHNKHFLLKLTEIDDRTAAEEIRGCDLEIPFSEAQPLAEGEYYPIQLVGLKVQTTQGELLGEVVDVWLRESNDIYVVRGTRGEVLIPAIGDVIQSIDLEKGIMVIEAIAGLLE